MAEELDKVDVVVVGTGWAGGIVSAELAKAGKMLSLLKKAKKKSAVTISVSKMNLDSTTAMTLCRT